MKSHTRNLSVLTALICCVILVPLRAKETGSRRKVTVRDLESQTILYTIHRGSYTGFGQAFADSSVWRAAKIFAPQSMS